jgi:inosose dehydratase
MPVRIGINPLTWSNDDMPELGGETSLETCLTEAKQAGYDGVELGNKFPRKADALRPILTKHGLALVSGWYSSRLLERSVEDEKRAAEDHLTLLKAMGCTVMVYAEVSGCVHGDRKTPVSRRPVLAENRWKEFGARMTEMGRYLQGRGVTLAYHHHMGTVIETEADIDRLMKETGPEVTLLLDTGHLTYANGDPLAVAKRHGGRVAHVHCKDVRRDVLAKAKAEDKSFLNAVLDGVFTVPGDGMVDYASILLVLKDAGYSDWLVVEAEQDPAKAHPLTYAKKGYETLSKFRKTIWGV